jgi:hypothetical protein
LQIGPCTFNIKKFQRHLEASFLPSDSGMAPKETKKDRERRLKKAEELTTDAPTNSPTDDDKPEDDAIAYGGEGGLVKPSTSTAAAAAATAAAAAVTITAVASTLMSDSSDVSATQGEKGSARARTGTGMPTRAKRAASTPSTRPSKPKKSKKSKKERRRRGKRELSSSSSDDRRRRRSPSSSSSSSSDPSGDSDWEDFYDDATVVAVRNLLKTPPPQAPRDVSKGRVSFEASGEVLFVRKADKGKKDKWMRESHSRRSDRYADYKGSISRLGHSGNDRVLQCNFWGLRPAADGH